MNKFILSFLLLFPFLAAAQNISSLPVVTSPASDTKMVLFTNSGSLGRFGMAQVSLTGAVMSVVGPQLSASTNATVVASNANWVAMRNATNDLNTALRTDLAQTNIDASAVVSGELSDARIPGEVARDDEVAASYQPLNTHLDDLADGTLTGTKVGPGVAAANLTAGGTLPPLDSQLLTNLSGLAIDGPLESFAKPTSGYTQSQWPVPQIMYDTWPVFGAINRSAYWTNAQGWLTNAAGTLYSNGVAAKTEPWGVIDDGWQATNLWVNGNLIENSNIFPIGMREVIRRMNNMGSKAILYSAIATNTCVSLAGSPTNYLRQHVFNMFDLGAHGIFLDMCPGAPIDRETLRAAIRIANLAMREWQALNYSTQGVVRPVFLEFVTGNGDITPGAQLLDSEFLTGANSLSWNWGDQAQNYASVINQAKESLKYLGPFIKPGGPFPDAGRLYSSSYLGRASDWAYTLPFLAMTCQQVRMGMGNQQVGTWTNGVYSGSGAGEGYEHFEMTNIFVRFFTTELMSIWKDPLCRPATILRTNDLTEIMRRPLINGDTALLIYNRAATNYAQTINVNDFGGSSNQWYNLRDAMWGTNIGTFQNTFTRTVAATSTLFLRVVPFAHPGEQTKSWIEVNVTGTGTIKQSTTSQIGDSRWSGGNEGLYQSAANQIFYFNLPTPWYATQAVVRLFCSSAYLTGAVAWTNNIDVYTYTYNNRLTQNGTPVSVVVPAGQATWATMTISLTRTNTPKEIVVTCGVSTNSSARLIVGALHYTFFGNE